MFKRKKTKITEKELQEFENLVKPVVEGDSFGPKKFDFYWPTLFGPVKVSFEWNAFTWPNFSYKII